MLFNKILEKIIKICFLQNFSKFEVKFLPVRAADYITPVRSSAAFPNRNMGLKRIPKFKKTTK